MNYDDYVNQIKRHEGFRGKVYIDSAGVPTGGWGHAFLPGSPVPIEVAQRLLWHDLKNVSDEYHTLSFPFARDSVRAYTIQNMLFNLGLAKLLKFKKFLAAVHQRDWNRAAFEMLNSRWALQVGNRADELAAQMHSGLFTGQGVP